MNMIDALKVSLEAYPVILIFDILPFCICLITFFVTRRYYQKLQMKRKDFVELTSRKELYFLMDNNYIDNNYVF